MGYTWPVDENTPVSQDFGSFPNNGYNPAGGHTGRDFAVPIGTPVHAIGDGVVKFADWATTLPATYRADGSGPNPYWLNPNFGGIVVIIDHGPGEPVSLHAHLSSTDLNPGDHVSKGQVIALSGNTGGATSGPHLHFEIMPDGWDFNNGTYGRVNPARYCSGSPGFVLQPQSSEVLQPYQRIVGQYGVNKRDAASSGASVLDNFPAGVILDFGGFVHGENANGTDIWFVGKYSGGYFSASAFDDASTNGLADLTPAPAPVDQPLKPNQRVTKAKVNQRKAPDINAEIVKTFEADVILDFKGYVRGMNVDGINDIWFVGAYSDTYFWSGGFTDISYAGLSDLSPNPTPQPAPPIYGPPVAPTPAPTPTPTPVDVYSFTPDFDFVEYLPANINNVRLGDFPPQPDDAVIHQFGTPGVDTVGSTVNQFQNPNLGLKAVSAHFVVSKGRIIQMVSLKDRAYHAYVVGNNYIGIETDPAQDTETIASVKKLLKALKAKYGRKLTLIRHKDVPQCITNCGSLIDLAKYEIDEVVPTPVPTPAPTPTPVPTPAPTPVPAPDLTIEQKLEVIKEYHQWQLDAWELYLKK